MPALCFFADADDVHLLIEHLNEDPEIAFLVPLDAVQVWPYVSPHMPPAATHRIGQQRWRAVRTVTSLADGQRSLWHTPAGELLEAVPSGKLVAPRSTRIADPWSGWSGQSIAQGESVWPEVEAGPGYSGIVSLDLWTRHRPYSAEERASGRLLLPYWTWPREMLISSAFQWIGGCYAPARKETTRWWSRLRKWFDRASVKLLDFSGRQAFYAFPSALDRLRSGIEYRANNWNLDASLRRGTVS